jgi:predicted Zn finger-like uncharacterized protein
MNVSCPECRSVFRVDPAKVPTAGVRARCSVCGGVITIGQGGAIENDFSDGRAATAATRPAPRPQPPPAPRAPTPAPRAPTPAAPTPGVAPFARNTPLSGGSRAVTPPVAMPPAARPSAPVTPPPAPRPSAPNVPGAGRTSQPTMPPRPQPAAPTPVSSSAPTPRVSMPAPAAHPPPSPPAPPSAPSAGSAPPAPSAPSRSINPFLSNDPNVKAKRLARALVSDIVAYFPQKREEGLRNGTLKQLFREEIKKSYEEYVDQMGKEFAETTTHFQDALNEVLAGGKKLF